MVYIITLLQFLICFEGSYEDFLSRMWVEDFEETVDDADYIQPTSESEEDESDSDLDSNDSHLDGELANWQADLAKWRDLDIESLLEDSDTVVKSMESMTVKFEEIDTSQLQPAINLSWVNRRIIG